MTVLHFIYYDSYQFSGILTLLLVCALSEDLFLMVFFILVSTRHHAWHLEFPNVHTHGGMKGSVSAKFQSEVLVRVGGDLSFLQFEFLKDGLLKHKSGQTTHLAQVQSRAFQCK